MSDSIPEYYRHLAEQRAEEETPDSAARRPEAERTRGGPQADAPEPSTETYRADAFQLDLPAGEWQDRSVYTLTGPTVDGVQHNITVMQDPDVEAETLYDFAGEQMAALEMQLDGCQVLLDDEIQLTSGRPAYRVIYVWHPNDDLRLYQEQLYVLHDACGYTLTASFTRTTRKQIGAEVEHMMRTFTPRDEAASEQRSQTAHR